MLNFDFCDGEDRMSVEMSGFCGQLCYQFLVNGIVAVGLIVVVLLIRTYKMEQFRHYKILVLELIGSRRKNNVNEEENRTCFKFVYFNNVSLQL